ncbi:MAG: Gfo/Idh/MocA family protein [Mariniblastus sp.]
MLNSIENLSGIIIGLGSIGNRHLNNLMSLGLSNLNVVRRSSNNNQHFKVPNQVGVFHDLETVLSQKPDFAVVCNPSHLHAKTAIQCLEAGVNVLIEKPLGRNTEIAERKLVDLSQKSNLVCAMAYCMRYHVAYLKARDEIELGTIGRVLYAKAWFEGYLPDWHPWEDYRQSYAAIREQGGGVLRTLDHELDFMNWVLGKAESASGSAINTGGIGIEADDLAFYQLYHPNDVISHITSSFCRKPQTRGFEFIGDSGTITFCMETGILQRTSHAEQNTEVLLTTGSEHINQMYIDLMADFLGTCLGQSSTKLPTASDGYHALDCIGKIDPTY